MGAPQYEQAGADIGGTGTTNTIPRWTGPSTLGDSILSQDANAYAIGVGAAPSTTWGSQWRALQVNSGAAFYGSSSFAIMAQNVVGRAGTDNYIANGLASRYYQLAGKHIWQSAATGVAGNAITFATSMTIDENGNVGIKQSSPSSFANGIRDLVVGANDGVNNYGITVAGTTQATLAFASGTSGGQAYAGFVQYTHSTSRLDLGAGSVSRVGVITTGLDVSTSGYGLKLPATPGNADTQTLDCYAEGTWAPTLTGFGGTNPTVAARYTRVGRLVTVQVVLTATGGNTFSSTAGSTYLSLPSGMTAAVESAGSTSNSGIGADGPSVAYTNGNLYLPTFALRSFNTFLTVTYTV